MVRLALRQMMRMTQTLKFGGPNIADKIKTGIPGVGSFSDLAHNYSLLPLLGCLSLGAVICGWYIFVSVDPKDMILHSDANLGTKSIVAWARITIFGQKMVVERSNEPDEKIAKEGGVAWDKKIDYDRVSWL